MVEAEFGQIWQQLEHEASHEEDPERRAPRWRAERDDYRAIAERRVRLGLLLSEIGQRQRRRRQPAGDEPADHAGGPAISPRGPRALRRICPQEPMAAAQLRAPLVRGQGRRLPVRQGRDQRAHGDREELEAEIESTDRPCPRPGCGHDHDHAPSQGQEAAAKKAGRSRSRSEAEAKPAKKAKAKPSRRPRSPPPKPPAKKPRSKKKEDPEAPFPPRQLRGPSIRAFAKLSPTPEEGNERI
jgi:trigger factor